MPGFANQPIFAWKNGSYLAQLRDDLIYEDADGVIYVAPNRFYTDFASIPRFLWWIASPYDPHHRLSATLHDYLYFLRGDEPYRLDRKACDDVFLRAMKTEGQSGWRRTAIYWAVRTFGGIYSSTMPWHEDSQASQQQRASADQEREDVGASQAAG